MDEKCMICNGLGRVLVVDKTSFPVKKLWKICWKCKGKGKVKKS